jgi:hypothetical protein
MGGVGATLGREHLAAPKLAEARRFPAEPPFWHQPACKPGSVGRGCPRVTAIPLQRRLPGASSNLPGRLVRTDRDLVPLRRPSSHAAPIRFCSRWGLPCRSRCRQRGALLPHRFTLTRPPCGGQAVSFSVALSLGSPPPDVIRHRLSAEPGLSSPATFRSLPERPSGRLTPRNVGRALHRVKPSAGSREVTRRH